MGGFEEGERYRGQQTTLPLEDYLPDSLRCPCTWEPIIGPTTARISGRRLGSVRVRCGIGEHVHEWLQFRCSEYRPYGGNPDYPDKERKYSGESQTCDRCFLVQEGLAYRAPFQCTKERHGAGRWPYFTLFNPNPLDHVDPHERRAITAGLKLLWQPEGTKGAKVCQPRTKTPKNPKK
jgi:hypothetical protein